MSALPPTRFELLANELAREAAPLLAERVAQIVADRYGEQPPLLDTAGAARLLSVKETTVRQWAREGAIPHLRIGDGPKATLRFDPAALRAGCFSGSYVSGDGVSVTSGHEASDGSGRVATVNEPEGE